MILVDTSVWVDYLRGADDALAAMLEHTVVLMHPMIIGELACGNLQNREQLLTLWRNLPSMVTATNDEALYFLEQHRLMGRGIGFIDVHLLAAVALHGDTSLWIRDQRLARLADELRLGFTAT